MSDSTGGAVQSDAIIATMGLQRHWYAWVSVFSAPRCRSGTSPNFKGSLLQANNEEGLMRSSGTVLVPIILAATLVCAAQSRAQTPTAHMGTLTCVLSPASTEPFGVERELSCDFEPFRGPHANFRGVVKRLGASVADQGKIVMIWAAYGPTNDTPSGHLAGTYIGSLGAQPRDGLVGGHNSSIQLKPFTAAPEFVNAALSILELELSATEV